MLPSCSSSWWLVGYWNAGPNFNWNSNSTPLIGFHYKSNLKVLIFLSSIVINIINIQMWILCNLCTRKPIPALSLSSINLLIIFSLWVEFKIYFHGHWWHIKTLFFNPLFSLLLHHPVVTDHLLLLSVMYLVMRFWPWLLCGWGGFILMFALTHFFTSSSKVMTFPTSGDIIKVFFSTVSIYSTIVQTSPHHFILNFVYLSCILILV